MLLSPALSVVRALYWLLPTMKVLQVMYRVLSSLVLPTVRVLPVFLRVTPLVRVLQVVLWSSVPLVMMMVWVLLLMVLGLGRWSVVGVGPCHSWQRAWRAALLVG